MGPLRYLQRLRSRPSTVNALSVTVKPTDWGLFGLATVASFCLAWTVWLMLLTAAPNTIVNHIMDTEILDDGSFWRFIDPPPAMLAVGLGGLGIVALGYLYIIARVTVFRHREFMSWSRLSPQKIGVRRHFRRFTRRIAAIAVAPAANEPKYSSSGVPVRQAAAVALDLVTADSSSRKFGVRTAEVLACKAEVDD